MSEMNDVEFRSFLGGKNFYVGLDDSEPNTSIDDSTTMANEVIQTSLDILKSYYDAFSIFNVFAFFASIILTFFLTWFIPLLFQKLLRDLLEYEIDYNSVTYRQMFRNYNNRAGSKVINNVEEKVTTTTNDKILYITSNYKKNNNLRIFFRTNAIAFFYLILRVSILFVGLFLSFLILRYDFFAAITSFGIGAFVTFMQIQIYFSNISAYACNTLIGKVRLGDIITIPGSNSTGLVIHAGMLFMTVLKPNPNYYEVDDDDEGSNEEEEYINHKESSDSDDQDENKKYTREVDGTIHFKGESSETIRKRKQHLKNNNELEPDKNFDHSITTAHHEPLLRHHNHHQIYQPTSDGNITLPINNEGIIGFSPNSADNISNFSNYVVNMGNFGILRSPYHKNYNTDNKPKFDDEIIKKAPFGGKFVHKKKKKGDHIPFNYEFINVQIPNYDIMWSVIAVQRE